MRHVSLVRAGLLAVMAQEPAWLALPPLLPGADSVAALARELAAAARRSDLDGTLDYVHDQLTRRALGGLADELLLADPGGPGRHLLIVVDQLEELLTQTGPTERAWFAELLRLALPGPVRVVGTVRPEVPRPVARRHRSGQSGHEYLSVAAAAPLHYRSPG